LQTNSQLEGKTGSLVDFHPRGFRLSGNLWSQNKAWGSFRRAYLLFRLSMQNQYFDLRIFSDLLNTGGTPGKNPSARFFCVRIILTASSIEFCQGIFDEGYIREGLGGGGGHRAMIPPL
jgi:hypothetical protein